MDSNISFSCKKCEEKQKNNKAAITPSKQKEVLTQAKITYSFLPDDKKKDTDVTDSQSEKKGHKDTHSSICTSRHC